MKRFSKEEIVSCFAIPGCLGILALFIPGTRGGPGQWWHPREFYFHNPYRYPGKGIPNYRRRYYTPESCAIISPYCRFWVFEKWGMDKVTSLFSVVNNFSIFHVSKLFYRLSLRYYSIIILLSSAYRNFPVCQVIYSRSNLFFFLYFYFIKLLPNEEDINIVLVYGFLSVLLWGAILFCLSWCCWDCLSTTPYNHEKAKYRIIPCFCNIIVINLLYKLRLVFLK